MSMASPQKQGGRFEPNYFYQFRLILIGDSTVGKSSLLRQFTDGNFVQSSDPTVGVDFHVRILQLNGKVYFSGFRNSSDLYKICLKLTFKI